MRCIRNFECLATKHCNEFGVDNLDDLLTRIECFGNLSAYCLHTNALDNIAHDADIDVCFEECGANLAHHFVNIGLRQPALAAQSLKYAA